MTLFKKSRFLCPKTRAKFKGKYTFWTYNGRFKPTSDDEHQTSFFQLQFG